MAGYRLAVIAAAVGGELHGDPERLVHRVRPIGEAAEGDLAVVVDRRRTTTGTPLHASAVIAPVGLEVAGVDHIFVAHPRQALRCVLELLHPEKRRPAGIAAGAWVSPSARLGKDVFVGAGAVIEDGAVIGDGCQIHAGVVVAEGAWVGEESILFPNVTLYPGVRLGRRVRIHSGAVIGSDGFGYDRDDAGIYGKIPQVGTVEIGDDVEIGANSAVDRATLGVTRIGAGTKVDNLVQIGHNCEIGEHCCIIGQVGLSGSVTLGRAVTLAGQVGVADHVTIAGGTVVGAKSGVPNDLQAGVYLGIPAIPAQLAFRVLGSLPKLPEIRKTVRSLERRVKELEAEITRLRVYGPQDGSE
ncbi:MAG: UDP-3-O-(3-hydroxymyristoyl)glucosamine N-acyltransferase [Acidobacteriota bacterium]